jgi:predicted Zn-dependent peptidase
MEIAKKTQYTRLPNGADIYTLKTSAKDIIVGKVAFRGGKNAAYHNPILTILLDEMLPGGTKYKEKQEVLDIFETLGARISVTYTHEYLVVTLASRRAYFVKAFDLLIEVIMHPSLTKKEFDISSHKLQNVFVQSLENTQHQSHVALSQLLFKEKHPYWLPSSSALQKKLKTLQHKDIKTFYKKSLTATGMFAVFVGDIQKDITERIAKSISKVPQKKVPLTVLHPEFIRDTVETDTVVTLKDKTNIDTHLGVPLFITTDSSDFLDFMFGISILGKSSTSRLFNIMRTRESLTYGAAANLVGGEGGYPPFLKCSTILPNDVFQRGRNVLRKVIYDFVDMGVTGKEVKEKKEEIIGKSVIHLSTTKGLCEEILKLVVQGKSLSEIDTFSDRIESMTTKKVNTAIQTHIDYTLAKTAAAGAVRADGTPTK